LEAVACSGVCCLIQDGVLVNSSKLDLAAISEFLILKIYGVPFIEQIGTVDI